MGVRLRELVAPSLALKLPLIIMDESWGEQRGPGWNRINPGERTEADLRI